MLSYFGLRRTYYLLSATIYVDVDRREAELSVKYDGRLKRNVTIPFDDVATPEKAEAYFTRRVGVHGTLLETLENDFKREAA